ncbi:hypothetical protein L1889_06595 [Paenalcaligenes niemegkensis]|uniref:hypothetical protein n=1 Tax=Paenalcaligenes niemegkensis TaxID=2895469 RepID=UPI001EE8523F|nr:hypothetical protein [Paenalcaligenes niemegkensis]MCQ9616414.1 hypothetical protein [Paenalcaligenes niemegkensis]
MKFSQLYESVIFDESFFDDENAAWELLIPIFGINVGSHFFTQAGIRGGMGATRVTIKKYLTKETLKHFQRLMLKYFGIKVTKKG